MQCIAHSGPQARQLLRHLRAAGIDQVAAPSIRAAPLPRDPWQALVGTGGRIAIEPLGWIVSSGLVGWMLGLCSLSLPELAPWLGGSGLAALVPVLGAGLGAVLGLTLAAEAARTRVRTYVSKLSDGRVLITVEAPDDESARRIREACQLLRLTDAAREAP
jgi:hypothetical protein